MIDTPFLETESDVLDMSVNMPYLISMVCVINIQGILTGYSCSYSNQVQYIFDTKFGYKTIEDKNYASALIGGSVTLGLTFGAAYGGKAISLGRRNALLLSNVVGIIGLCISIFEIFNLILIGRFIFGFASGL